MKRILVVSFAFALCSAVAVLSYAQGPTPGTWLYDQNENKVDDRIETLAEQRPDSLIGIIVDLSHRPTLDDSLWLTNFGRVSYVMQYIPSISLREVAPHIAFEVAENLHVVMVELDEVGYVSLDVSVRAIKARNSTLYSPSTAWEATFRGGGMNIAILDTGVDDGHPSLDDMDDDLNTADPKFVAGYDATAPPPQPRTQTMTILIIRRPAPGSKVMFFTGRLWPELLWEPEEARITLV